MTFTITEPINGFNLFASNSQANGTGDTASYKDIQIEAGSVATEYEPFTNGPTPNPTHPQEIKLAGVLNEETGRYEHKCCVGNKNFWNVEYANVSNRISNVPQGGYSGVPVYVGKGNTITISYTKTLSTGLSLYAGITECGLDLSNLNGMTYWLYHSTVASYIRKTITFIAKYDYIWICCMASQWATFFENIGNDLQIEISSSATELLPHASQPFTITSDRPLTMWDKLVKRDGVWGWSVKQTPYEIDESADWYAYDSYKGFFAQCCFPVLLTSNEGYCNQLRNDMVGISASKVSNHFWIGNNRDHFYVLGSSYYDESLEDKGLANWKSHLAENPLEIWTYADTEQAFIPLPEEEQTLLNNLETYYGVTNIYNEQGCPMWLKYCADQELHWNQKLLQIQQAII